MVNDEVDVLLLSMAWVDTNLIDGWWNLCVSQHVSQKQSVEVRHSDCSSQALCYQFLHRSPQDMHWPLVLLVRGSCEEVVWPMNQVQVHVIRLQFCQRSPQRTLYIGVLGVEELCSDKEV